MKAWGTIILLGLLGTAAFGDVADVNTAARVDRTELRIKAANAAIQKEPGRYQNYNDLAYYLVKRAEETANPENLEAADAALAKSLSIAPNNFQGEKAQVMALLDEHEYAKALDEAKALNRDTPDDVLLWGYLADAESALGDYESAEKSAQWMVNLRPGNVPGFLRGAELRVAWGDSEGALEFLGRALQATPSFEAGDTASILTRMADIQLATGKVEAAEASDQKALEAFPNYYAALESLARVRVAQKRYDEAIQLLETRIISSPRPGNFYVLAEALERAGRKEEAKQAYAQFETQAQERIDRADNANRELIFYYSDHSASPSEALRIANLEIAKRHDLFTLDAYAWALYANRNYAAASTQIGKALAVGTRDSGILFHAGAIQEKLNGRAAATNYLRESIAADPSSATAAAAREVLERLAPASAASSNSR